jgi:dTMP kinase
VFITLEGPDGAGKSSQAVMLAERLRAQGLDVVLTREPGGTELGEQIRDLLLHGDSSRRDPLADAALFNAARRQLVTEVIGPALERGAWVVCDRFADSTLAYQGYGAGAPLDTLRQLADAATGGVSPDRTVLFDLEPEEGLARRASGPSSDLTRFELAERHDLAYHRRVREGYLQLVAAEPDRWRVVDASQPPAEVAGAAWQALADLVPQPRRETTREG